MRSNRIDVAALADFCDVASRDIAPLCFDGGCLFFLALA
jgi:hypothetical protein